MKEWFKDHLGILITLIVTVIYLIGVLVVTDLSDYHNLKLNEKGDVLAGIFSPLAFLWLVYGYLQQGQELKQNTLALSLQAQELKNSVEQQKVLANAALEQLNILRNEFNNNIVKSRPILQIKDCGFQQFAIVSSEGIANNISLSIDTTIVNLDLNHIQSVLPQQKEIDIDNIFTFTSLKNIIGNKIYHFKLTLLYDTAIEKGLSCSFKFKYYKDQYDNKKYVELVH
ncbi:hypothetical protein [Acinetobacter colistiniresistens]|uniref:hypothetical protein n=1 Tax=Acinetobacter colistiniresistens TaxID=280145 RepID=UPI000E5BD477|nr:hypothetical protein [Acinetobacter colistiniresistens]